MLKRVFSVGKMGVLLYLIFGAGVVFGATVATITTLGVVAGSDPQAIDMLLHCNKENK